MVEKYGAATWRMETTKVPNEINNKTLALCLLN